MYLCTFQDHRPWSRQRCRRLPELDREKARERAARAKRGRPARQLGGIKMHPKAQARATPSQKGEGKKGCEEGTKGDLLML